MSRGVSVAILCDIASGKVRSVTELRSQRQATRSRFSEAAVVALSLVKHFFFFSPSQILLYKDAQKANCIAE